MRWLLLAVLLLPVAHSLSASPASHTLYTPDGASSYTLLIHNDENRAVAVSFSAVGPFAESIEVPDGISLQPQERRSVDVRISVPDDVQPGLLEGGLLIESRPAESGATVSAASAVMHSIRLRTPQQGAFIEGELLTAGGAVGRPSTVTFILTNTGTEEVSAQTALARDGQLLVNQSVTLAPGTVHSVVGTYTPDEPGQHAVTALARYAGKEIALSNTVTAGDLSVAIEEVSVGAFVLGQPFRASVQVRNHYGQPLLVTPSVSMLQNGSIRTTAIGVPLSIPAGESAALPVFLESAGLSVGEAELRAQITYAGQLETLTVPAAVHENRLLLEEYRTITGSSILLFVGAAVGIMLIFWYGVRWRKRR